MRNTAKIAVILAAGSMLGGCQSILKPFGYAAKRPSAEMSGPLFGEADLEEGRQALKAGYPATAIPAFQRATLNADTAPAAFNGLGVAYAKLHRGDLAEKYFTIATKLAPTDERYAANLARFYNSGLAASNHALAARKKATDEMLAEAEKAAPIVAEPVRTVQKGPIRIELPAARISRMSNKEVRLITVEPAPGAEAARHAKVEVRNPAPKPQPKAEATENEPDEPAETKAVERKIARASGYPVRFPLRAIAVSE